MQRHTERGYFAVKDADGSLRVMHAALAKAPAGAVPISDAEATALSASYRPPREARPAKNTPDNSAEIAGLHREIDAIGAEIGSIKADVAQIIGGLKQIYHENKAVAEGKR